MKKLLKKLNSVESHDVKRRSRYSMIALRLSPHWQTIVRRHVSRPTNNLWWETRRKTDVDWLRHVSTYNRLSVWTRLNSTANSIFFSVPLTFAECFVLATTFSNIKPNNEHATYFLFPSRYYNALIELNVFWIIKGNWV